MQKFVAAAAGLALLSACSNQSQMRSASTRPLAAAIAPASSIDPNEAVWHLRAGLNVAALLCKGRGRVAVAPSYAQMLRRHRGLLAAAYTAEQHRQGSGFDRHETRTYNRFSNQHNPASFCRAAAGVAKRAAAMDSPTLARSARGLLGELD